VVIVGSLGLASNIVGLFLFHGMHDTIQDLLFVADHHQNTGTRTTMDISTVKTNHTNPKFSPLRLHLPSRRANLPHQFRPHVTSSEWPHLFATVPILFLHYMATQQLRVLHLCRLPMTWPIRKLALLHRSDTLAELDITYLVHQAVLMKR
jgi:Co/Zn/Cd efflux system component